jgi:hypothetical protein
MHNIRPKVKSEKRSRSDAQSSSTSTRTLLTANTNLGQHFLRNPAVVDKYVLYLFNVINVLTYIYLLN